MSSTNSEILVDPKTAAALSPYSPSRLASMVRDAPSVASTLFSGDVDDRIDVNTVCRNVAAIVAVALREHDDALFESGISALAAIWDLGRRDAMYPTKTPDREASLWEELVTGLYALGGLAVQLERWHQIRELTLRSTEASMGDSWLRQGQVASDRAAQAPDHSVLGLAAARLQGLDPDVTTDRALAMTAQFDLISALIMSERDATRFFPNAAEFGEELVEPLVVKRLRQADSLLREQVFPGDQDGLREALRDYDAKARTHAAVMRYHGRDWRWRAFADGRTWTFIDGGYILEEWPG